MAAKKKARAKRIRPRRVIGKLKEGNARRVALILPEPTPASLIEGDTRKRLDRFCEAHDGANADQVVIHAVNDYITRNLDANEGVSARFNSTQA